MGEANNHQRESMPMDEEFKKSPAKSHHLSKEGHGKKQERDRQKSTPAKHSGSPRNGPHKQALKDLSLSPVSRAGSNMKDRVSRWTPEDQRSNAENWREHKIQLFNRKRKDSNHDAEDGHRWQESGERSSTGMRKPNKKGTLDDCSNVQAGGTDSLQVKPKNKRRYKRSEREDEDLESPVIDESMLSNRELMYLQQAEDRLKENTIYRLKRRPRQYPTATYSCKLCDTLLDSISMAERHIRDKKHKKNLKEKQEEELLTTLPPPLLPQTQAIGSAIEKIVQEHGLNEDDLAIRQATMKTMQSLVQQKLPGCTLRLYGSSFSKLGFRTSDMNIDIQFPNTMNQPDVLLQVQESLKQCDLFADFDTDFHARVPVVVCRDKKSGLLCKVSAGNENACLTSNLLATLGTLEPRLVSLVVVFRYWAKICGIDRPEEGGIPPYAFALMTVFYLQQRKDPVLPVYLVSWIEGFSAGKLDQFHLRKLENDFVIWEHYPTSNSENTSCERPSKKGQAPLIFAPDHLSHLNVGQLWVDLLRFYSLEFNMVDLVISIRVKEKIFRELKDWSKKRIAIEDPYSVKRNVARSLHSQIIYEYILHCLRSTYKYFAMPQVKTVKKNSTSGKAVDLRKEHTKKNPTPIPEDGKMSELNRKLEDFTIDDSCTPDQKPLQINCCKDLDRDCNFTNRLLYDSENNSDCKTERRLCKHEDSVQSGEELESCSEDSEGEELVPGRGRTKHYAMINQGLDEDSESGEGFMQGNEESDSLSDLDCVPNTVSEADEAEGIFVDKLELDEDTEMLETSNEFVNQHFETSIKNESDDEETGLVLNRRDNLDSLTADELEQTYIGSGDETLSEDEDDDQGEQIFNNGLKTKDKALSVKTDELLKDSSSVESTDQKDPVLFYEFNKPTFTRGKCPSVVCNLCKRDGHVKKDCPEDFKKIELEPLPSLTPKFRGLLDEVCIQCYDDFSPTILEDRAREHIRQNLEDFIKHEFEGARLSLFGSSKNGFGFKQSDLDICMTINGVESAEELDCIRAIENLARHLKKHQDFRNILPITTAKVPIVKFYHVRSGLEGDISLYNTLALHNTRLLASYAAIDARVKYLCYIMKVFTKMCDIGDASRGSLSSYAYTLMVLYFLQQRDPPVIPVLQEIYKANKKPEIFVDGWNVYFFSELDQLAKHWPETGKNKESVGELWLGLLRYYTEEFDFKEYVICIRRKSLLTTFKKQWTSKYIVIEDPFDLNHNLGAGLSRKMTNFIMKAFINGRRLFGTPVKGFPKEYPSKMEYFFDPEVLTEGELAPNDRCCRICGKIGHFMKDCPMRRKMRRRNHEGSNQRYQEKRLQWKTEDNDGVKDLENDASGVDGKLLHSTPQKPRQMSACETSRDKTPRHTNEKWRRPEDREMREKRCFVCGREGHIKKECPHYKGASGSPKSDTLCESPSAMSPQKHARSIPLNIDRKATYFQDEKKQKVYLSPQSGSLSNKYMSQGKASQKRTPQDS